jgi:hypothetical protein
VGGVLCDQLVESLLDTVYRVVQHVRFSIGVNFVFIGPIGRVVEYVVTELVSARLLMSCLLGRCFLNVCEWTWSRALHRVPLRQIVLTFAACSLLLSVPYLLHELATWSIAATEAHLSVLNHNLR